LLGTATGTMTNWVLLWLVIAAGAVRHFASVWSSAVVTRFDASRGLALAITLCAARRLQPRARSALAARALRLAGRLRAWADLGGSSCPVLLFFRGANDGDERKSRQAARRPVAVETHRHRAVARADGARGAGRSALYKQMMPADSIR